MHSQSLAGRWSLRQPDSDTWLPAAVPGSVHLDLLSAGLIPDPFLGDNEKAVQWVAQSHWEYRRSFAVSAELAREQRIFLVCDGLDTLAEVYLNGVRLGAGENMYVQYRWEITGLLKNENDLLVRFFSPVLYAQEHIQARPLPGPLEWIAGGQYLRKTPSHFGWDWGPHIPAVGIWKDIRLEGHSEAYLEDVHLRQDHTAKGVTLQTRITAQRWGQAPLLVRVRIWTPDGELIEQVGTLPAASETLSAVISSPHLWWPNGYGDQPLYRVEVALLSGDTILNQREYRIGLRTVQLIREPDQWGESFRFLVNGVPIFCKGSNWIPADSFPTRVTLPQLEHLIKSAADTHQNMLRVWGGGYYESEEFYDLCDRYGLLIWQDFMFACAVYPLDDPAYVENIHQEVLQNVRRLRHRPCMALWCGNNEMELGWAFWGWKKPETMDLMAADEQFFYHTLPGWVAELDPDHAYWPSSPSAGRPGIEPNGEQAGDAHDWEVWHMVKPFNDYRARYPRFVSEFGFQSLPSIETVAGYAAEEEWNMTSYTLEYHQRHPRGNTLIMTYLANHFRMPNSFDSLVYLTQVLQAEGMRIGIEHWRRSPQTGGTLYWQLNDCWPVASWSSMDYYGRWKALHYAARRIYAPLLLSVEDGGPTFNLYLTSDLLVPVQGEVYWSLETLGGVSITSRWTEVVLPALSTALIKKVDINLPAEVNPRDVILTSELRQAGGPIYPIVTPLVPSKHLRLQDPGITAAMEIQEDQLLIDLTAQSLARFVEVRLAGAEVQYSDNYFDIPAGRQMSITCRLPRGWDLPRAREALRIRSLIDSYR